MELIIGIIVIVAIIVGFMLANDVSERHTYEDMRKGIGEKFIKKEKDKENL